jgi:hypothetical protein
MENYEEILIKHFTEQNQKAREKAIEALERRDFNALNREYFSYVDRKNIEETIHLTSVEDVINQLQLALKNIAPNQTVPNIETHIEQEEERWATDVRVYLYSYSYTIRPIEMCASSAYHFTRSCLWKIKHQPNGNDTKRYLEIINRYL